MQYKRRTVPQKQKDKGDPASIGRFLKSILAETAGLPGNIESIIHQPFLPTSKGIYESMTGSDYNKRTMLESMAPYIADLGIMMATGTPPKSALITAGTGAGVQAVTGSSLLGGLASGGVSLAGGLKSVGKKGASMQGMQRLPEDVVKAIGKDEQLVHDMLWVHNKQLAGNNFGKISQNKGTINTFFKYYNNVKRKISEKYADLDRIARKTKYKIGPNTSDKLDRIVSNSLSPSREKVLSDVTSIKESESVFDLMEIRRRLREEKRAFYGSGKSRPRPEGYRHESDIVRLEELVDQQIRNKTSGSFYKKLQESDTLYSFNQQAHRDVIDLYESAGGLINAKNAGILGLGSGFANLLSGNPLIGAKEMALVAGVPAAKKFLPKLIEKMFVNPTTSEIPLGLAAAVKSGDRKIQAELLKEFAKSGFLSFF